MMSERRMASFAAAVKSRYVIANDALEAHLNAQFIQLFGEVERVGVLPMGSEQL